MPKKFIPVYTSFPGVANVEDLFSLLGGQQNKDLLQAAYLGYLHLFGNSVGQVPPEPDAVNWSKFDRLRDAVLSGDWDRDAGVATTFERMSYLGERVIRHACTSEELSKLLTPLGVLNEADVDEAARILDRRFRAPGVLSQSQEHAMDPSRRREAVGVVTALMERVQRLETLAWLHPMQFSAELSGFLAELKRTGKPGRGRNFEGLGVYISDFLQNQHELMSSDLRNTSLALTEAMVSNLRIYFVRETALSALTTADRKNSRELQKVNQTVLELEEFPEFATTIDLNARLRSLRGDAKWLREYESAQLNDAVLHELCQLSRQSLWLGWCSIEGDIERAASE